MSVQTTKCLKSSLFVADIYYGDDLSTNNTNTTEEKSDGNKWDDFWYDMIGIRK